MHELGLLRGVVRAVEAAAAKAGAAAVERVGLRVGELSGAVPEALRGAWPIATAGSRLAGATLEIEQVGAAIHCQGCHCDQPVDQFYALRCPACGAPCGNLVHGREFEVAFADARL
ncbi:MAG: hydrogenase maturation nickel metallochaperone HypA [Bifidobacteriaceae bacterium]|jgi:hydrogenase nickel incorporation protein HypA/HybF|nr:hydrogenase maturation nickel metallochaperone HypA [Bifidobacteriaceae bacterium]